MRLLLFILNFIASTFLWAQPTTISVLGRSNYVSYPSHYGFAIDYIKAEFDTDKLTHLLQYLESAGVRYQLDTTTFLNAMNSLQDKIEIITNNPADFDILTYQASYSGMEGQTFYLFGDREIGYEDALALEAFKDAERRAEIIAAELGKEIKRVRNIDDQVEQYLFYFEMEVIPRCREMVNKILELFTMLADSNTKYGNDNTRAGQYALWVTFELK